MEYAQRLTIDGVLSHLPGGFYIYGLQASESVESRKMFLLKLELALLKYRVLSNRIGTLLK
jgi:hypothetical protein